MAKITVSYLRDLLNMERNEEITFSRLVEMLNEKAEEKESFWASGFVTCDLCSHEWIAVRPAETDVLECPHCGNVGAFTTPEDM